MDRRGNRGDLEFLPGGRVSSPLIRSRLWTLLFWKLMVQNARVFLINSNLVGSPRDLPGYYDFVKRVFFHIKNHGHANAVPLIEADVAQFKQWGFSGNILRDLARLQIADRLLFRAGRLSPLRASPTCESHSDTSGIGQEACLTKPSKIA